MKRLMLAAAATLLSSGAAFSQTTGADAAGPSAAKKELVQRVVAMQQPAVEALARQLAEQPAQQLLAQAQNVLMQRVAAEKRQAIWQQIEADARRYVEEATPVVRERALKVAPDVMAPILESRLTEDELKQVLQTMQMMESPAFRKFGSLGPELQRALNEKVVADVRGTIEGKVRTMQEAANKRMPAQPAQPGAAPGPASAAAPTKKQ